MPSLKLTNLNSIYNFKKLLKKFFKLKYYFEISTFFIKLELLNFIFIWLFKAFGQSIKFLSIKFSSIIRPTQIFFCAVILFCIFHSVQSIVWMGVLWIPIINPNGSFVKKQFSSGRKTDLKMGKLLVESIEIGNNSLQPTSSKQFANSPNKSIWFKTRRQLHLISEMVNTTVHKSF